MSAPDGPDSMFAAVALLQDHRQLPAEAVGIAEGPFDAGGLGIGEGVVEVGAQVLAGDIGHAGYCSMAGGGGEATEARQANRARERG